MKIEADTLRAAILERIRQKDEERDALPENEFKDLRERTLNAAAGALAEVLQLIDYLDG